MIETDHSNSRAFCLASRFEDLFDKGAAATVALGLLLCWIWMALSEGYPAFIDGAVDSLSVVSAFFSFSIALFVFGFVPDCVNVLARWHVWAVSAAVACVGCLFLYLGCSEAIFSLGVAELGVTRFVAAIVGVSAAVLVACCAVQFSCFKFPSGAVGFVLSVAVMFASYFGLNVCDPHLRGVLFCLLPAFAVLCLLVPRESISAKIKEIPVEVGSLARGFASMCVSFGVFFFAIGAKCAFEPASEFANASDTSVACMLLISLVFLYVTALKRNPLGAFRVLGAIYGVCVMALTVCIAMAPLSLEPYVGVVYNADCLVLMMMLWLLTAYVARSQGAHALRVIAVALGSAVACMAIGWFVGVEIHQALGHSRSYPTIALACVIAVFSTVGFSKNDFLRLGGDDLSGVRAGASSATVVLSDEECSELVSQRYGLSDREQDVFLLLSQGYAADSISDKLTISYHTARSHIRNVYKKLDVHSNRELLKLRDCVRENRCASLDEGSQE